MTRAALLAILMTACGGAFGQADDNQPDANGNSDGQAGMCTVSISFDPAEPVEGQIVRAISHVENASGVAQYTWHVFRNGTTEIPTTPAQDNNSQVLFTATIAASYSAFVDADFGSTFCPQGQATVTVAAPGANETEMRIHVVPPPSELRPPLDKLVIVKGGGDATLSDVVLDPGVVVNGNVLGSGSGIPSYIRFLPVSGREAVVESFSDATGAFTARVLDQPHDVLVVPATSAFPPTLVRAWMPSQGDLAIDAGMAISGVVQSSAGAAIVGAKVQLTIDGVPSTLATTNAGGAFTLRAVPVAGGVVRFDVSPPASTGLPRLTASSSTFDLSQSVTIHYGAITTRDLGGTIVRRAGSPLAAAKVSVVGTLGGTAGTVTAGVAINGSGEVRFVATTSGTGALPTLLAPAAVLSAVIEPGPGDAAISALDLTAGVPATINAPAMVAAATTIHGPTAAVLGGVSLDAIPIGALALAGGPSVHVVSAPNGTIATSLAAGGHYDLRFSDPAGRGAILIVSDVTAGSIAANHTLVNAVHIGATVTGESGVIRGAAVQILCSACSGIERSRPLAEIATGSDGKFLLAVPDPG